MTTAMAIRQWAAPENKRILAVDDDPGILDTYIDLLQPRAQRFSRLKTMMGVVSPPAAGFELSTAHQGDVAVKLVGETARKSLPYAAAFLDMRMPPGMNGLATAKAIRAIDARIFIVIVTAYSDHSIEEIYRELGHDVLLLRKPFAEDELLQLARTLSDIWNRDGHRLQQLDAAKRRGNLLEQNLFVRRTRDKDRRRSLPPLERIPRVTLLDRDRVMLARLRAGFPQVSRYASLASSAFRRQPPPELLVARIEATHPHSRQKLTALVRRWRHDTAFLFYGPGVTEWAHAGSPSLHGALIGTVPENPDASLLAHATRCLLELRAHLYDLSNPDWPLLGKTAAFKQCMNEANKMARIGRPVLIRGRAPDVMAMARYMQRTGHVPGAIKTLSGLPFARYQSIAETHDAFHEAMRGNVSACLLIDSVHLLPTDFIRVLIDDARTHGVELIVCGAEPNVPIDTTFFEPFVIQVPELSQRREDWRLLANYFALQYAWRTGASLDLDDMDLTKIHNQSISSMQDLRDAVFSCLISEEKPEASAGVVMETEDAPRRLDDRVGEFEAAIIAQVLKRCEGNVSKAARLLGVRPNTLHYRLKRHGIDYKR